MTNNDLMSQITLPPFINWTYIYRTAIYVPGSGMEAIIIAIKETNAIPAFMELIIVNVLNPKSGWKMKISDTKPS